MLGFTTDSIKATLPGALSKLFCTVGLADTICKQLLDTLGAQGDDSTHYV
jgi:hypothetical protein